MKTVRDDRGTEYLLLKRSEEASLVRNPETGTECYVGNDRLEPADGESSLEIAALAVPDPVRSLVTTVHDSQSLGLLCVLDADGPYSIRWLLESTDLCESDLSGMLASLRMNGFVEETTVDGERGYRTTERCTEALNALSNTGGPSEE
ncbi:DUF7346 family protein [Halovivax gelatinilyticus]|uniref:DUF7346 family protein n=1 Tax=Halovivax gelatinilyticus TaxID=2961597 RepID=UPI0020CA4A94|nr:hypothetical protein [Halovivax gelatinilyticus]